MSSALTRVRDRLMFAAGTEAGTRKRSWQSDGTTGGTRLVGTDGSDRATMSNRFTAVAGHTMLVTNDAHGNERLWALQPSGELFLVGHPRAQRLR